MEISGLVSALVIGSAVGLLGRLVLPGRQHIGVLWTLVVGMAAALLGSLLASVLGVGATGGVDWIEWLIQIALACLGVTALDRALAGTERRPWRRA
ncbi:GlsB/YeaQ/YmgE family stress response membrane protein [Streptomyces sindenensis]|uniref:GlsB/YeaQ/YmgE family stress response membrane protein n=1 Tax=Streptomyces sindenensis TaxID=67363 RepID=A0ABW6ENT1_9ACTN